MKPVKRERLKAKGWNVGSVEEFLGEKMKQPKTKVVTLEGTSTLTNKQLADAISSIIFEHLAFSDYKLTQKPRVQAAQGPRKEK